MTTQTKLSGLTLTRQSAAVALDAARAHAPQPYKVFRPTAAEHAARAAYLAPYIDAHERAELAELAELIARPDVAYPEDIPAALDRIAELAGVSA